MFCKAWTVLIALFLTLSSLPASFSEEQCPEKDQESTMSTRDIPTHRKESKKILQTVLLIVISAWCLPSQGSVNPHSTSSFPLITRLPPENCYLTIALVQDSWRISSKCSALYFPLLNLVNIFLPTLCFITSIQIHTLLSKMLLPFLALLSVDKVNLALIWASENIRAGASTDTSGYQLQCNSKKAAHRFED